MSNIFRSRKFYAALMGLLLVFFGNRAGISDETLNNAVYVLISYILGTGLEAFRKG